MERFESRSSLHRKGKETVFNHYEVVYTAALPTYQYQSVLLESLYEKFNLNQTEDFKGHSLSVSDIVVLSTNGMASFHYVDSIGL